MRASLLSDVRLRKASDTQSLRTLKLMLKKQKINVGFPSSIFFYNFSSVILKYNNKLHIEMYSLILASGCQAVFIKKIMNMLSPPQVFWELSVTQPAFLHVFSNTLSFLLH